MTFTRLKCTPPKLSLHLDDLGRKILFHFEFGLLSSVFSIGSPQVAFFLKIFFMFWMNESPNLEWIECCPS